MYWHVEVVRLEGVGHVSKASEGVVSRRLLKAKRHLQLSTLLRTRTHIPTDQQLYTHTEHTHTPGDPTKNTHTHTHTHTHQGNSAQTLTDAHAHTYTDKTQYTNTNTLDGQIYTTYKHTQWTTHDKHPSAVCKHQHTTLMECTNTGRALGSKRPRHFYP